MLFNKRHINCQVRKNKKLGHLELFYFDHEKDCISFCFHESHNIACDGYRLKECAPVEKKEALDFMEKVQSYYDSVDSGEIMLTLKQKLKR